MNLRTKTNPAKKRSAELLAEIAAVMEQQGMTQTEMAARTGLAQANISRVLSGRYTPRVDMLERLASTVGLKLTLVRR